MMIRGEYDDYFSFITLPWAIYFALLDLQEQILIALSSIWDFLIHSLSADTAPKRHAISLITSLAAWLTPPS